MWQWSGVPGPNWIFVFSKLPSPCHPIILKSNLHQLVRQSWKTSSWPCWADFVFALAGKTLKASYIGGLKTWFSLNDVSNNFSVLGGRINRVDNNEKVFKSVAVPSLVLMILRRRFIFLSEISWKILIRLTYNFQEGPFWPRSRIDSRNILLFSEYIWC